MSVASEFKAAENFLQRLDAGERKNLREICARIQRAEQTLWHRAAPLLEKCMATCEGLCCRNINLDDILARGDFLYILTLRPDLRGAIAQSLEKESPFSADCIFLQNGVGPCLFPSDLRPKICIMTFCFDDAIAKRQIRQVGAEFDRLGRFVWSVRIRSFRDWILALLTRHRFRSAKTKAGGVSKLRIGRPELQRRGDCDSDFH